MEESIKNITALLNDVGEIIPDNAEPGNKPYNIFEVLGVSRKEVIICRFLADLLDPNGAHQCGILFLKSFLNEFIYINEALPDDDTLRNAYVKAEYPIDENRRIDIIIDIEHTVFVAIEAKIYASDQKNQCADYLKYAENYARNYKYKLIYLTRDGAEPSEYSLPRGTMAHDLLSLSFKENIHKWLENVLSYDELKNKASYTAIEQYKNAIAFDDKQEAISMEVKKAINSSCNNLKSAYEIYKNFEDARRDLKAQVIDEFKQCDILRAYKTINAEEKINTIDFKIRDKLILRIGIDHRLYSGVILEDQPGDSDMLDKWVYLPTGNKEKNSPDVPNFKDMNEAAFKLCDDTERKELVKKSIERIKELIDFTRID